MDLSTSVKTGSVSQGKENGLQRSTSFSSESTKSTSTTTSSPSCSPVLSQSGSICEYEANESLADNNADFSSTKTPSEGNNPLSNTTDTTNSYSFTNEVESNQTTESICEMDKLNKSIQGLQEEIQILFNEKNDLLSRLFEFSCINTALENICRNLGTGFIALKFIEKNKACLCNEQLNVNFRKVLHKTEMDSVYLQKQYDSLMIKYRNSQKTPSTAFNKKIPFSQFNGPLKEANEAIFSSKTLTSLKQTNNFSSESLPHVLNCSNLSFYQPQAPNKSPNFDYPLCSVSSTTENESKLLHSQNQIKNQSILESTHLNKVIMTTNTKKQSSNFLISSLLKPTEIVPTVNPLFNSSSSFNAQNLSIENVKETHVKNNNHLPLENINSGEVCVNPTETNLAVHLEKSPCFNEDNFLLNEGKTFAHESQPKIKNSKHFYLKCEWPECNQMFDNEESYFMHREWHRKISNFQCPQTKSIFEHRNLNENEIKTQNGKYQSNTNDKLSPVMSKDSNDRQINVDSQYLDSSDDEVEVVEICKPECIRISQFNPSTYLEKQDSPLKPISNVEPFGSQSFQSTNQTRFLDMMPQNKSQKLPLSQMPFYQTSSSTLNFSNATLPSLDAASSQRIKLPVKFNLGFPKIDNFNLPSTEVNVEAQPLNFQQRILPLNHSPNSPHVQFYQRSVISPKNSITEIAATAAAAANKARHDKLQAQSAPLNQNGIEPDMVNFDPVKNYRSIAALSHELNINKRSQYSGIGRYQCPWPDCRYTPYFLRDLRRHMFKHTGDRKYKCNIFNCQFETVWKTSLLQHYRKIHKDIRMNPRIVSCYEGESSTNETPDKL